MPARRATYRRLFQRSFHRQEFQRKPNWLDCALDLQSTLRPSEKTEVIDSHIEDLFSLLEKEKPKLLGGSPPCGPFSQLQNLVDIRNHVPQSVRSQRLQEGKKHLRTSVRAYRAQMEAATFCTSIRKEHAAGKNQSSKNFETIHVSTKLLGPCVGGKWNQKTRETRA